eukprot:CAMPEP_0196710768 /NCGR_PEP_ID=MMETSP1090-20130531/70915_1 /TAXON_ID=37098 /ORGANISM="Isochrysis sp, Strain CCMP1244" /LENGTH=174 /DNA_ID=CAMNT_0042050805 /DNA_START=43 /DNA_END=565 /DNA_ORIENTATION=-
MHGRTLKKTPLPPGTGPSPPRPRALWPSAPRTATGDRRGGILETSGSEQSHSNAPTTRTSTATANIARRPLLHPGKLPQLEVPQPRVLHDPATFAFLAPRSSAQVEGVLLLECVVASTARAGPADARMAATVRAAGALACVWRLQVSCIPACTRPPAETRSVSCTAPGEAARSA